ncbi:MAG: GDP-mannose 4,6-dehydratase [Alphaproteobacteria bacterium]|nr:GDP-mannose 4,6-dehydratase [Alphaproteobacteria bacterium]
MKILVTGTAGFIGFHLCKRLLEDKHQILGIDNINNYYDVKLKKNRLKILLGKKNFKFKKIDISDANFVKKIYPIAKNFRIIIHLAAQAGVRYSITHPYKYIESNVKAQISILELAKKIKNFEHLIYASSSSVYGSNKKTPFSIDDRVDNPISLYGASKRSGELITQSYSKMFNINCTGLRFFSVYGPWGRPDMAAYIFTKNIFQNKTLDLFNFGRMERDFTFIDDIINGITPLIKIKKRKDNIHKIYNLGNNKPQKLLKMISLLEMLCQRKAKINKKRMQPGDVRHTYANIKESKKDLRFKPKTNLKEGLEKFVAWYKNYHNII